MSRTFAYADPPYQGVAHRYPEQTEVNHPILIEYLRTFDGWALSCKSGSLRDLLPLCPPKARVLSWVKHYAPMRPNVWPCYAWEPVILVPLPGVDRTQPTPQDWTSAETRTGQDIVGQKPPAFCVWLFRCARLRPGDGFVDVFPGSGAVSRAWHSWAESQGERPLQLVAPGT